MAVTHKFLCDPCNIAVEDTTTKGIHYCPECGKPMRVAPPTYSGGCHYKHPIHSDSLAIHPSQRLEHERMFPNIEIDGQNRPVFNKYVDHEAYLKKCGFVKQPKKIKRKGIKL